MITSLEWLDQIDHKIFYLINDTLTNPIFDLFFTTITNEGDFFDLEKQKGKIVMLQFTASWCSVCIKEMPHIENEIWKIR